MSDENRDRNFEPQFISIVLVLYALRILQVPGSAGLSLGLDLGTGVGVAALATAFAVWNRRAWWWLGYVVLSLGVIMPTVIAESRDVYGVASAAAVLLLLGSIALAIGAYINSALVRARSNSPMQPTGFAGG